jgi:hypothetical protein
MAEAAPFYHAPYACRIPGMYLRQDFGAPGPQQGSAASRALICHHGAVRRARGCRSRAPGAPEEAGQGAGLPSVTSRRPGCGYRHRSPAGRRAAARCGPGPPGPQPAVPGTRQLHRRYTAGTSARPGRKPRRRTYGAGPPGRRDQVHRRATAGTRQDHRRSMAPGCLGAERSATTRSSPCIRTTTPSPPTARTAPENPQLPRLPEATGTGPARWRLSPERSACWSRDRSRWPCSPGAAAAAPAGARRPCPGRRTARRHQP